MLVGFPQWHVLHELSAFQSLSLPSSAKHRKTALDMTRHRTTVDDSLLTAVKRLLSHPQFEAQNSDVPPGRWHGTPRKLLCDLLIRGGYNGPSLGTEELLTLLRRNGHPLYQAGVLCTVEHRDITLELEVEEATD
jgi:hypothetical protein